MGRSRRLSFWGMPPLDMQNGNSRNDTYAFRKNIAMLIDAGVRFDEINAAAKDLYDINNRGGVFLENNTQRVWVERRTENPRQSECKGYELFARSLKITAGDDSSYWEWTRESLPRGEERTADIEVARLKTIKWLEVRGKFSTIKLTANTRYKVYFCLKATDPNAWNANLPVTFRLYVPNMGRQERQQTLSIPSDYKNYEVGEFVNDYRTVGTIQFHMEQLDSIWKGGLFIKSVRIEPQTNN